LASWLGSPGTLLRSTSSSSGAKLLVSKGVVSSPVEM
jgi:hypothetical protein